MSVVVCMLMASPVFLTADILKVEILIRPGQLIDLIDNHDY